MIKGSGFRELVHSPGFEGIIRVHLVVTIAASAAATYCAVCKVLGLSSEPFTLNSKPLSLNPKP